MPYISEDKLAQLVDAVVARLQNGESEVPLRNATRSAPANVNPPYGCDPLKKESSGFTQPSGAAIRDNSGGGGSAHARASWSNTSVPPHALTHGSAGRGVFVDLDEAVDAAARAFQKFQTMGLKGRYTVIAAMRDEARRQVETISRMAIEETGLGRYDQKIIKNTLVIDKTPGPEILEPFAQTGDDGLMLEEFAPFGVIGAIAPTTNPTETVICNAIGMLSAGNAVVFAGHPSAKKVSAYTVQFLNEAIIRAGGPENLITCTAEPSIELAQKLMKHPGVRLLVVTGGPGVVKAAMASGKKVIAAGPGNPPAVVDETADLDIAAEGLVKGISLDNNIVCTAEKEIIAVGAIADDLKAKMARYGAYELKGDELARVEKVVVDGDHVNKNWVGKDAALILREAGIQAPQGTLVAYGEVPENHPFVQIELLTPVTGLVRVRDVDQAIAMAVRCEHGNGHTACMYSRNIAALHAMACVINTSIFTKNAPTYAGLGLGGEGYTSFTIASPTGEGLTNARHFSRRRRCTLKDYFRNRLSTVSHQFVMTTLVVRDYDEAIAWYTRVLGFELIEDTRLSPEKRWVVVGPGGGARLLLAKADNDRQTARIGDQTGGRVALFLHTSDCTGDYARLSGHGVIFIRPPVREAYGTVCVFADLYGNLWDLIQPA